MIPLRDDIPSYRKPVVTIGLIVANVVVFFLELSSKGGFENSIFQYGAIPSEVTSGIELTSRFSFPIPLTLFTSMFMHGGLFHLGGNMLYLWIFGDNMEDKLGHIRFFFFYIICGIVASLTHILTSPNSEVPMIGASGAIAGVLGAYFIRFPGANLDFDLFWIFHQSRKNSGSSGPGFLVYSAVTLWFTLFRFSGKWWDRLVCSYWRVCSGDSFVQDNEKISIRSN